MQSTRLSSSRQRPPTSSRPISSRKQAGYVSGGLVTSGGKKILNPLEHVQNSFSQFLEDNKGSNENQIKNFKKDIYDAIIESSKYLKEDKFDMSKALEKAKEAQTHMKNLQDFITSKSLDEPDFKTIKFTVNMQLADAYKINSNYEDAIKCYKRLINDREFPYPFMIYLELGNINVQQQKYEEAVNNYTMGDNYLKPDANRLKARFSHATGVAQIHMCQYHQALSSFEKAMKLDPNIKTGFNLVLCHSILSSPEDLRDAYNRMIQIKPVTSITDIKEGDELGNQLHVERRDQVRLVMLASRLVAARVSDESNWQEGYDYVFNKLKQSKFPEASGEFEVTYSLAYIKHKKAKKAIEMLRGIRRKDPQLMALAATNLSFLYYLEHDFENADKYANIALENDKYNAQALVNKGNCLMHAGKDDDARDQYLEAIGVEADCVEALYNLGIVSKKLGKYEEALQVFEKLNRIIPKSPEVLFEISDCYEQCGLIPNAIDWLHRLLNVLPTDPAIWSRLGGIWDRDQNEKQAFQCYSESYKYCPSDIEVISWLGMYFRKTRHFDNALKFFERAAALAPKETRYLLMVASCYRNMDMKPEALQVYEKAIQIDPNNKTCLEHLIKLNTEMGDTQKCNYYASLYKDLTDRLAMMQAEEQQQREYEQQANYAFQTSSLDKVDNPMEFRKQEVVVAPELNVGDVHSGAVSNARAGEDNNMWDDVDIDLPD